MKKEFSIKRVIIALVIVFSTLALIATGYYVYSRTFGETEYCQSIRKQKGFSIDYNCSSGEKYQKDGNTYVNVSVNRPGDQVTIQALFTMDAKTKKITSEAWTG